MLLQAEGRTTEALEWAERTRAEAEAADDAEALGDAYFVMGWAYGELGKEGALDAACMRVARGLPACGQPGAAGAACCRTLGVVCQWEGRWDEALSYYERGRDAALKIGSAVDAAVARVNIAEILIDRGEWAEAEALLAGNAAAVEGVAVPLLPGRLPTACSDGCRCARAASTRH